MIDLGVYWEDIYECMNMSFWGWKVHIIHYHIYQEFFILLVWFEIHFSLYKLWILLLFFRAQLCYWDTVVVKGTHWSKRIWGVTLSLMKSVNSYCRQAWFPALQHLSSIHRLRRSPTGEYPVTGAAEYIYLLSIKFLTFQMSGSYIFLRLEKGLKGSSTLCIQKERRKMCCLFTCVISLCWF